MKALWAASWASRFFHATCWAGVTLALIMAAVSGGSSAFVGIGVGAAFVGGVLNGGSLLITGGVPYGGGFNPAG